MNLFIKSAALIAFLANSGVNASRSSSSNEVTFYFDSELAADPYAVRTSADSMSTGKGTVTVRRDGTVTMNIMWIIRGDDGPINKWNPVNGIHVHAGNKHTNGPIVFGFCGQDDLPAFGGTCQQGWPSHSAQTGTQYEGKICNMNIPDCYNNGQTSAAEAAELLIDGQVEMYVNIHTKKSFDANKRDGDGALGLIRGQLSLEAKARPTGSNNDEVAPVVSSTSREMESALRGGQM
eukprot:scaffold6862_cov92-Skeletonema_dohrnii-CCMP3373.AAC.6